MRSLGPRAARVGSAPGAQLLTLDLPLRTDTVGLARFAADGVTADGAGVRASLGLGSRAEDVDRLLAALASLRAHGPAWTYAAPEAGYVPVPDPRALPDWLASAAAGPAAPCSA